MPSLSVAPEPDFDLICIGFGPAALAIAVALQDLQIPAKVLFLEKQKQFAWHAGMLLPGAKMQISFLKDLATFRDPRSHFTFLNYLQEKGRLEAFTNLSTFLPLRQEFNDYLTWAARQFEHQVEYNTAARSIEALSSEAGQVSAWKVTAEQDGQPVKYVTRNVVIATGGKPELPEFLRNISPKINHTSHYLFAVPSIIPTNKPESELNLVVVGGGQSSAETFNDLASRYPEARVTLYTPNFALKPSDDSPFVNEIFNPSLTSELYKLPHSQRNQLTTQNRATNYSVVRPELLDHLYSEQYQQRLRHGNDETTWRHRIIGSRRLTSAKLTANKSLSLSFTNTLTSSPQPAETLENVDLLLCGTGYSRNGQVELLQPISHLVPDPSDVSRTYKLSFPADAVEEGCGIWLQGLCEGSHGLSDSLLSILAVRAGEVVGDIFGTSRGGANGNGVNGVSAAKVKVDGHVNGVERNGVVVNGNGH